jgi:D-3-phosphoglycerate dehydrogenase
VGFRVGVTADIRAGDGSCVFDFDLLDAAPGVEWEFLAEHETELAPGQVEGYDALVVYSPRVSARSLDVAEPPLVLARLGVGYDRVDLGACNAGGVLVTITPDGVRRPMAAGAMAFLLALAHRIPWKDRATRERRWEWFADAGVGLQGRTLGLLGMGNVGADLASLAEPFGLRRLACDPYLAEAPPGVELVDLDTLFRTADFLVVACPLTDETRGLVDAGRLAQMKPSAFLINIARGPIVDQAALTEALVEGRIAGAALDVFEEEPVAAGEPLLSLDNVILAPHAIGLTDELFATCGRSASQSVLAVAEGRVPEFVVNREALAHPRLRERLR